MQINKNASSFRPCLPFFETQNVHLTGSTLQRSLSRGYVSFLLPLVLIININIYLKSGETRLVVVKLVVSWELSMILGPPFKREETPRSCDFWGVAGWQLRLHENIS